MMRLNIIATLFVALSMVAVTLPAQAADLKIGVVNLGRLVMQSPQAKQAREAMKEKFSARKEELENKRESFQSDVERLKRDGAVMSEEAREKLESSLRDQQRRLKLLQEEYNEDVSKAEQDELEGLREDIRAVIDSYADENNYDLILGDAILFASDAVDITDQILERLKDRL